MINITKHALRRYVERFKLIEKELVEQYVNLYRDKYQEELDKMFNCSRLIYTGKFSDKHTDTNFRLVDNIILITDKVDTKIITLYRVDFGFDRDTDLIILRSQIDKLDKAEKDYLNALDIIKEEKESLLSRRDTLSNEIETMEETLKTMKESLKATNDYIKKFGYEERMAKTEVETIAKKIVYSNIYRKEMQECLN